MTIEARTAFDRLLAEGEPTTTVAAAIPAETEEAQIVRQNREAVAAWGALV